MSNANSRGERDISRRRLLQSTGSAVSLLGVGSVRARADDSHTPLDEADCSETTFRPAMTHYDDSIHEVCADDHPETEALQAEVHASLEEAYPTVGAIIDAGFIPYFDFFTERGSWSHWINPDFLNDDSTVDPARPESILVDHTFWRPIGVMFIATDEGKALDPPPSAYENEDGGECTPWHAHVGLPGRYAWWKYQAVYRSSPGGFPCRTPWMMHVWRYPHSESIYAHAAPEERGGPPAERAGFDTDANPQEEEFGPEHLPEILRDRVEDLF